MMRPPNEVRAQHDARSVGPQKRFTRQQTDSNSTREAPEHGNDRRAFLIWACMLGAVPPERVAERVLAEVESEVAR